MLIPSMGYIVGLLIGLYVYRKPREYLKDVKFQIVTMLQS